MKTKNENNLFPECLMCQLKKCELAKIWNLDICEYGISYVNDGERIQRVTASGTLRHLSQNIRHELNKVLQLIISEACCIDPYISLNEINKDSPASKIVAAALIIDNFISMISGVNDFHLDTLGVAGGSNGIGLLKLTKKYWDIFSLIKSTHRAGSLRLEIDINGSVRIAFGLPLIEYMIAVFVDNAYKHAIDGSILNISCVIHDENQCDLTFTNYSAPINNPEKIFRKGYQEKFTSDGFGFGLFWANILAEHYNQILRIEGESLLSINHTQSYYSKDSEIMKQSFSIKNIRVMPK